MKTIETKNKPQKSTILLLLCIFLLFNAAHLFRTSIGTIFFTEDISGDYTVIEATVLELKTELTDNPEKEPRLIPVFTFLYEGEQLTREAPAFVFEQKKLKSSPYQPGTEHTLWIHNRWGTFVVPPILPPGELGVSQLRISLFFLLLAVGIWILRNKIAKRRSVG